MSPAAPSRQPPLPRPGLPPEVGAGQVVACASPAAALQRISDALRAGLLWYVSGLTPARKWPAVELKLRARYPTLNRDRKHLSRERKVGRPAVRLIVLNPKGAEQAAFVLLSNMPVEGDGETWRNARSDRIHVWSYEAVRQTRSGADEPAWTWRIQKPRFEALRAEIVERVRKRQNRELLSLSLSSKNWPGFAPVRRQHFALGLLLKSEWARSRSSEAPPPEWPRLGYVRRLKTR